MSGESYEFKHLKNEVIETNMKLADKLRERGIITDEEYDEELKSLADLAGIKYTKPEPAKSEQKGWFWSK